MGKNRGFSCNIIHSAVTQKCVTLRNPSVTHSKNKAKLGRLSVCACGFRPRLHLVTDKVTDKMRKLVTAESQKIYKFL